MREVSRRGFLRRVVAAVASVGLAPLVPLAWRRPSGISVSFVRRYDLVTDARPTRIDVLYGWAAVRPELACRLRD